MIDNAIIDRAVEILRAGGLVAFPTETVYGLGADAANPAAVRRIFQAKGRPPTNPLILHVANSTIAQRYSTHWPATAEKLSRAFWPGPLTLVLPRHPDIAPEATAFQSTVGLRAPNHPLTLELLTRFNGPLAGPSANRSTRISPTTAAHVQSELPSLVDLILDGGPCSVGIESTVLDLTTTPPTILRPGAITQQQIQSIIGPVNLFTGSTSPAIAAPSPGMHDVHYAPQTPAFRYEPETLPRLINWQAQHPAQAAIVLNLTPLPPGMSSLSQIQMPRSPEDYARHLYAALHDADARGAAAIWIELPPNDPAWQAIRDRIRRSAKLPPAP